MGAEAGAEIDAVWQRLVVHQGETFRQVRGRAFTYTVENNALMPSTTNRRIGKTEFARALARLPVRGPGELQDLQGPSYIYALLSDERITV